MFDVVMSALVWFTFSASADDRNAFVRAKMTRILLWVIMKTGDKRLGDQWKRMRVVHEGHELEGSFDGSSVALKTS